MVIIFFQECRCDTVSQECEFLETLKYSSHHCETPKSTEIVKIAIFSGFSDFRSKCFADFGTKVEQNRNKFVHIANIYWGPHFCRLYRFDG